MPVRTCIRCGFTTELTSTVEGRGAPRFQGWPRDRKGKLTKRCFSCQAETAELRGRRQENEDLHRHGLRRCRGCGDVKSLDQMLDYNRGLCRECRNEQARRRPRSLRQIERARAAERGGRDYRPIDVVVAEAEFRRLAKMVGTAHRAWFYQVQIENAFSARRFRSAQRTRDRYWRNRPAEIARSLDKKRVFRASLRQAGIGEGYLSRLRKSARECGYCGGDFDGRDVNVDHIIPLSAGGTSDPSNLIAVCGECNRTKATKPLELWMAERGLAAAG